jgi:hypothetical protein
MTLCVSTSATFLTSPRPLASRAAVTGMIQTSAASAVPQRFPTRQVSGHENWLFVGSDELQLASVR